MSFCTKSPPKGKVLIALKFVYFSEIYDIGVMSCPVSTCAKSVIFFGHKIVGPGDTQTSVADKFYKR